MKRRKLLVRLSVTCKRDLNKNGHRTCSVNWMYPGSEASNVGDSWSNACETMTTVRRIYFSIVFNQLTYTLIVWKLHLRSDTHEEWSAESKGVSSHSAFCFGQQTEISLSLKSSIFCSHQKLTARVCLNGCNFDIKALSAQKNYPYWDNQNEQRCQEEVPARMIVGLKLVS